MENFNKVKKYHKENIEDLNKLIKNWSKKELVMFIKLNYKL